jgi:hypothetical protein
MGRGSMISVLIIHLFSNANVGWLAVHFQSISHRDSFFNQLLQIIPVGFRKAEVPFGSD